MMNTDAPHLCIPRTSQPAQRSFVILRIDGYAVVVPGW